MSVQFSLLHVLCFIEIPVVNLNSVDPDQMLHSATSDLGLHCLTNALLGISKLKWVKILHHQNGMPSKMIHSMHYD